MYNPQRYITTLYSNSHWGLLVEVLVVPEEKHIIIGKYQPLDIQDSEGNWISSNLGRYVWVDDIKYPKITIEIPEPESEITRDEGNNLLLGF